MTMNHDLFFQAMSASQAASTAMALFFSAIVATTLFFTQTANSTTQEEEANFAATEIHRYEGVRLSISDRATVEQDPRRLARLQKDLKRLTRNLEATKQALSSLEVAKGSDRVFAREDLRGSLNALQDSGSKAIDAVMQAELMPTSRPQPHSSAVLPIGFISSASTALGSDPTP